MRRIRDVVQAAAIAAALALSAGITALAQDDRDGQIDRMVDQMTRELNLTAEQQLTIKAAFQAHQGEFQALRQRIREERRALLQTLQEDEYDPDAVESSARAIGDSVAETIQLMAAVKAEVDSELTPEQRQKFTQLLLSNRLGHGGRKADE